MVDGTCSFVRTWWRRSSEGTTGKREVPKEDEGGNYE